MFGDVSDKMRGREAVVPLVNVGISEADIEAGVVDGVFGVELASILAGVATPDTFIGEGEIAVRTSKMEVVLLEKVARDGFPIVVAADEGFSLLVNSENGAAMGMSVDTATLAVDERGDIFVKQSFWVDTGGLGGGSFLDEKLGIELLIDFELAAESIAVDAGEGEEVMMGAFEILAMNSAEVGAGAGEGNHKSIIPYQGNSFISFLSPVALSSSKDSDPLQPSNDFKKI